MEEINNCRKLSTTWHELCQRWNRLGASLHELERLKVTHGNIEAVTLKDNEIEIMQSHINQLTQSISQLSLLPSQEEAKECKELPDFSPATRMLIIYRATGGFKANQ
jgi:protein subunit release factor A